MQKNLYFARKHIWKNLVHIVLFVLHLFCVADYCKCSNKTSSPIRIFIGLVDVILSRKTLGHRLSILTQILIGMAYYFFFYISEKHLQFRKKNKSVCLGTGSSSCETVFQSFFSQRYIIHLKGIGKILFGSVLRILLICKYLNFTTVFIKKVTISKVCIELSMWKSKFQSNRFNPY